MVVTVSSEVELRSERYGATHRYNLAVAEARELADSRLNNGHYVLLRYQLSSLIIVALAKYHIHLTH